MADQPVHHGGTYVAVLDFPAGGYRYAPAVFQYSGGVSASPGFAIERYRFRTPLPLTEGFARIRRIIEGAKRPLTAFCACELRSPAPFTEQGFREFNERYVLTLKDWGLLEGAGNPVARSNVCPEIDPPAETVFHAFSFTVPAADAAPAFVIAGSAEAKEGANTYGEATVRRGEIGPEAMRDKARFVLGEMERRLGLFGLHWGDVTATQVYTVHGLSSFYADEIVRRGAARAGIDWHFCRPPVQGLEFEMDCRGVALEHVI
jgi:hypothetical protein